MIAIYSQLVTVEIDPVVKNAAIGLLVALTTAGCARAGDVSVCEPLRTLDPVSGEVVAAALTVNFAAVGGRDVLELWVCSRTECAPAVRVSDQTGLLFQWRADGALDVVTGSLAPERLPLPPSLTNLVVDIHAIDGRVSSRPANLESRLSGAGPIGGFGRSRCRTQARPSWRGLGGESDRPAS
jgi:hypothetical protein